MTPSMKMGASIFSADFMGDNRQCATADRSGQAGVARSFEILLDMMRVFAFLEDDGFSLRDEEPAFTGGA